jgi:hypothetical protein
MKRISIFMTLFFCLLLLGMTSACKSRGSDVWKSGSYGSGGTTSSSAGKFGACEAEDLANKSCK